MNATETLAFEKLRHVVAYDRISAVHKGSNYLKYGNFAVILDEAYVVKYFAPGFEWRDDLLAKARAVRKFISPVDLPVRIPDFKFEVRIEADEFHIWTYVPGTPVTHLLSNLTENQIWDLANRMILTVRALETLGRSNDVRQAVGEHYELSTTYEALFRENESPRILTHGDMNVGNIALDREQVVLYDWDNLSYQKQDLIFANILLFWLMPSAAHRQGRFETMFNSISTSIRNFYDFDNQTLIRNTVMLAELKMMISMNATHVNLWAETITRLKAMVAPK